MSIRSWKRQFYDGIRKASRDNVSALEHSIKKWEGLRLENLTKHEIGIDFASNLYDDRTKEVFKISCDSCALCQLVASRNSGIVECKDCPLYKFDKNSCQSNSDSAWINWWEDSNPGPMIENLKGALKKELKNQAKGRKKCMKKLMNVGHT